MITRAYRAKSPEGQLATAMIALQAFIKTHKDKAIIVEVPQTEFTEKMRVFGWQDYLATFLKVKIDRGMPGSKTIKISLYMEEPPKIPERKNRVIELE